MPSASYQSMFSSKLPSTASTSPLLNASYRPRTKAMLSSDMRALPVGGGRIDPKPRMDNPATLSPPKSSVSARWGHSGAQLGGLHEQEAFVRSVGRGGGSHRGEHRRRDR